MNIPLLRIPIPPKNVKHVWYKFYSYINNDYLSSGWTRQRILSEITSNGYQIIRRL